MASLRSQRRLGWMLGHPRKKPLEQVSMRSFTFSLQHRHHHITTAKMVSTLVPPKVSMLHAVTDNLLTVVTQVASPNVSIPTREPPFTARPRSPADPITPDHTSQGEFHGLEMQEMWEEILIPRSLGHWRRRRRSPHGPRRLLLRKASTRSRASGEASRIT
jgi:hypothetical protein